jgi:hypothetical protein
VAYDCDAKSVVFNPDGALEQPCEHFIYLNGMFCQWELLPDSGTRVSLANILWHHPDLAGIDIKELYGRIMEVTRSVPADGAGADEPPFQTGRVRWQDEVHLSRQETIALLDELGWDQVPDDRLVPRRFRLNGWVVFASPASDFIARILRQLPSQAAAER